MRWHKLRVRRRHLQKSSFFSNMNSAQAFGAPQITEIDRINLQIDSKRLGFRSFFIAVLISLRHRRYRERRVIRWTCPLFEDRLRIFEWRPRIFLITIRFCSVTIVGKVQNVAEAYERIYTSLCFDKARQIHKNKSPLQWIMNHFN